MKRLRLRKIWVVFAVFMLLVPLLSGRMEKSEATSTTTATATTTAASLSGQPKIWFITSQDGISDIDFKDTDGLSDVQWNLKTSESSGFVNPNTGYVTAILSIDGQTEADMSQVCDKIIWTYNLETANASYIMDIQEKGETTNTKKMLQVTPKAAGLVSVYITATGYDKDANGSITIGQDTYKESGFKAYRRIIIGSPLLIYDSITSIAPDTYMQLANGKNGSAASTSLPATGEIYANNAAISTCDITWFYVDAETDKEVRLERPYGLNKNKGDGGQNPDIPDSLSQYKTSDIISVGTKGTITQTKVGDKLWVYPYTINVKGKAGFVRLIGRIYLDGKSTSSNYIQMDFDVMVAPEIEKNGTDLTELEMEYGDYYAFTDISNDVGNSLEWKAYSDANTVDANGNVLKLVSGKGLTANNYGEVSLEATALYEKYESYASIQPAVTDVVKVKVKSSVLKGVTNKTKIMDGTMEVINVGGSITLSTNVVSDKNQNYVYKWYYEDGTSTPQVLTANNGGYENSQFTSAGQESLGNGNYSSIKITGKKSGEDVKIRCVVYKQGESESNAVLNSTVTIRITDTMSLSESKKTIAVGNSFTLEATTSINNGNVVEWTVDKKYEEYLSVVSSSDKSAVITGLKETTDLKEIGGWIEVTATQEINGTTVSAVCLVKVIPGIDGAEIVADPDSIIAVGGVADLTLILDSQGTNFTKDEIKWILKDKDDTDAESIITLKENSGNILKATVTGNAVGEAYVAVVTNDTAQTQIAIITIRVVSEVSGIKIVGDKVETEGTSKKVVDYLDASGTGSCQLRYKLLPENYVNEDLPVVWSSNNENIATVDENGLVTYHGVGIAIITVNVSGIPSIADTCIFTIENPATGIELSPYPEYTMKVGDTLQMKAVVVPETVTDATITWTSSDSSVLTVDNYGMVQAVSMGSAIITATTSNGIEARCIITVLTPVEGIELNYTTITVKKGTIFYLSAKVTPDTAYDKSVIFTSSDESVATVEADGTVTALKVGTAEITVTSKDNPEISAVCTVIVTEAVAGLTLNAREITIDVGEQYLLKATVKPSDAENTAVTFETADASIATVDENGLITGVKGGVTVVFVKTVERGLIASCTVTVQEDITSITMAETETYIGKGKDKQLKVTIQPASATQKKLQWKSSNESIVIVDQDGNIHGVNLGTAIITATAMDDGKVFATCKVTVVEEVTKLTLNQSIIRLMQNDTYQLTCTVEPASATVKGVTWSTSDASVARVDSLGLVTAVGQGEAKIRATAMDNSGTYVECTVIVTPLVPVTSIQVNTTATTMLIGDTRTLTARANPRNTTEGVRWVSSDTSIAKVNNNGYVEAVGAGVCKITAISSVTGLESTSTITVLGLNATDITLEQYDSFDLYLDGVEENVTWFSRNKRIATVSKKGVVTARKEGTTDIVARVNGKLVACQITVEKMKK